MSRIIKTFMEDYEGEQVLSDVRNFENETDFFEQAQAYLKDTRDSEMTLGPVETMDIVITPQGEWEPYTSDDQEGQKLKVFVAEIEENDPIGIGDTEINPEFESVMIIAHKELKEVLVSVSEIKWRTTKGEDEVGIQVLTLDEISNQLNELGYDRTYYVWVELGLSGKIYQYGNYDPPTWQEHGTTKGYA